MSRHVGGPSRDDGFVGRLLYATPGYTTHDRRFIESAVTDGWRVDVVRFDGGRLNLEDRALPDGAVEVEWEGRSTGIDLSRPDEALAAFGRMASRLAPDVIHAGPLPSVAHVAVGVDVAPVLAMSWASDLLVEVVASPPARDRASAVVRRADALLVDADCLAELIVEMGGARDRIEVMPWGVDLEEFAFVQPEPLPGHLRLVSLRSMEAVYDLATVLRGLAEASHRLPGLELSLTVAGSGTQEAELRSLAEKLGIEPMVRWVGRVSEPEVRALVAAHDLTVSAALSDGSSLSMLQALSIGRRSIVTAIPSNLEWITSEEIGLTFAPGSVSELADAMIRASVAPDSTGRYAQACRALAEARADWSVNRRRVTRRYERLASAGADQSD